MNQAVAIVGPMFRSWRERRRMSQLEPAVEAGVSQKHVSFVESGRADSSRAMVLQLAGALDVPLRERNALLAGAGFAAVYPDRPLEDPSLGPALDTIRRLLKAHQPYPALAVDRRWNLVAANAAVDQLVAAADPKLLAPPVNVMRLSLQPRGLAPLIVNLGEWRAHLLERVRPQARFTADTDIEALLRECEGYAPSSSRSEPPAPNELALPLRLRSHVSVLSVLSTVTVFARLST